MIQTQFKAQQFRDGTFTDQNQLASALLTTPHVEDQLTYALGDPTKSNRYGLIQSMTTKVFSGSSATEGSSYKMIGNNTYEWHMQGAWLRTIPITDNAYGASDTPGYNFQPFTVNLAEKYFSVGDVCMTNSRKLIRLKEEPYQSGNSWCHTFQLSTYTPEDFVPASDLQSDKVLAWSHTMFEEGSEGGGSKEATPMAFRNTMTIQRMAWGMTGGAKTDVMVFKFKVGDKANSDLWLYKKQYENLVLWNRMQEAMLWNSRTTVDPVTGMISISGSNGRSLRAGSGIEEQISGSNQIIVNELTEDVLQFMLTDIDQNYQDVEDRKMMVFTGMGGIREFDRAMKRSLGGLGGFVQEANTFIEKKGGNKLAYGSQFTTYRGLLGTEFTVVHHPFFDDKTIWTEIDPATGYTTKSFEMFFLDFSVMDGTPNIQLISKGAGGDNRRLKTWFTAGATTPSMGDYSKQPSEKEMREIARESIRSNGYDGFMNYYLSETGVIIRNPLRCGKITVARTF